MSVSFEGVFGAQGDAIVTDIGAARGRAARPPGALELSLDEAVPEQPDAHSIALRALGRSALSAREVRDRLVARDVTDDAADDEVERLRSAGLVDDEALALDLVDRLRERKHMGGRGIRQELRRRGIDDVAIDAALADDHDDAELAIEAARDRARRLGSLDRATAERRLSAYLGRRGFDGQAIRRAIEVALPASGPRFR